jgi:hypothetical protein
VIGHQVAFFIAGSAEDIPRLGRQLERQSPRSRLVLVIGNEQLESSRRSERVPHLLKIRQRVAL